MAPRKRPKRFILIHADESCLRNGAEGASPGGAGMLLETATPDGVVRRDVFISAPDTTNNRMALAGAIAAFALISQRGRRYRVLFVSDSEYLVKGMTEWMPAWKARGWRRRGGRIENLELWQKLAQATEGHDVRWQWVRGHAGHPKNEYVDDLAIRAAGEQIHSNGAQPSHFEEWLSERQRQKLFAGYDPDDDFAAGERSMARES